MSTEWWKPENLRKSEKNFISINALKELDPKSDFGAYRRILLGDSIENAMLGEHNDLQPIDKIVLCAHFSKQNRNNIKSILDVGCGAGYTTAALAKVYTNALVDGIDISSDAIAYAQQTHITVNFICDAIEPTNKSLKKYDLIFCFEFYPFTRTNDYRTHVEYIDHLSSHLNNNGELIIFQLWDNPKSLSANLAKIRSDCTELQFRLVHAPHKKLIRLFRVIWIARFADVIISFILRMPRRKIIYINRK